MLRPAPDIPAGRGDALVGCYTALLRHLHRRIGRNLWMVVKGTEAVAEEAVTAVEAKVKDLEHSYSTSLEESSASCWCRRPLHKRN